MSTTVPMDRIVSLAILGKATCHINPYDNRQTAMKIAEFWRRNKSLSLRHLFLELHYAVSGRHVQTCPTCFLVKHPEDFFTDEEFAKVRILDDIISHILQRDAKMTLETFERSYGDKERLMKVKKHHLWARSSERYIDPLVGFFFGLQDIFEELNAKCHKLFDQPQRIRLVLKGRMTSSFEENVKKLRKYCTKQERVNLVEGKVTVVNLEPEVFDLTEDRTRVNRGQEAREENRDRATKKRKADEDVICLSDDDEVVEVNKENRNAKKRKISRERVAVKAKKAKKYPVCETIDITDENQDSESDTDYSPPQNRRYTESFDEETGIRHITLRD